MKKKNIHKKALELVLEDISSLVKLIAVCVMLIAVCFIVFLVYWFSLTWLLLEGQKLLKGCALATAIILVLIALYFSCYYPRAKNKLK